MEIEFACPGCGHSYTLGPGLAGRLVRCKACKAVNRLPTPKPKPKPARTRAATPAAATTAQRPGAAPRPRSRPEPEPEPAADRFGFDDDEPMPAPRAVAGAGTPVVDDTWQPPVPRRAPIAVVRTSRRVADGEPWGLGIRNVAIAGTSAGWIIGIYRMLVLHSTRPDGSLESNLTTLFMGVGFFAAIIAMVGATVSFLGGNARAYRSGSIIQAIGWYFTTSSTTYTLYVFWVIFSHPELLSRRVPTAQPDSTAPAGFAPGAGPQPTPYVIPVPIRPRLEPRHPRIDPSIRGQPRGYGGR